MDSGTEGQTIRVRLPKRRNNEQFATAELMMGANHIRVRCFDGVTRMGRIKGKIKKRAWIREGDIVIVTPWTFRTRSAISSTGTCRPRSTGSGGTGTYNPFLRPSREALGLFLTTSCPRRGIVRRMNY